MKPVERFLLDHQPCIGESEDDDACKAVMGRNEEGAFVYYSEYAAALAKVERLEKALTDYVRFSDEAARLLDADRDVKCLKLLLAMAGVAPRYRHDVDEACAALNPGAEERGRIIHAELPH